MAHSLHLDAIDAEDQLVGCPVDRVDVELGGVDSARHGAELLAKRGVSLRDVRKVCLAQHDQLRTLGELGIEPFEFTP